MWFGLLDDQSFRWAPDRAYAWSQAKSAHASVIRTVVRWDQIAKTRPSHRLNPFDPAYNFKDLDDFMISAQQRGIEVLLTLWGTPAWANGGAGPAVPPTDTSDFAAFAHDVAERYSGAYPGLPFARFFSIWNEPNSPTFLQSPDPAVAYAALAEAGYGAVKAASPAAVVALGETAASHAPATFVDRLAAVDPTLRFDAWAHHPYPATPATGPDAPRVWPNVGLLELGRLGDEVDRVFHRQAVPLWVTEYAEPSPYVRSQQQARDLARAAELAAAQPNVQMFVWLMLRNHPGTPWQSGISGTPALSAFRRDALRYDPRNPIVPFAGERRSFLVQLAALELRWHLTPGSRVGIKYVVTNCGRRIADGLGAARIARDGWVPVSVHFAASPRFRYTLQVTMEDVHGFVVTRTLQLVPSGGGACGRDL
jgi:cellulase (glycosyl hydrolase family 5)